jgi:S-adenosylmethionine decarboxylase
MRNGIKVGRHAIFELYRCDAGLLDNEQYIVESMIEIANTLGATVLSSSSHKFEPQGVTAILLLSESHISIHTWPEKGLATCDIFTCGTCVPENGIQIFKDKFKAVETNSLVFDR